MLCLPTVTIVTPLVRTRERIEALNEDDEADSTCDLEDLSEGVSIALYVGTRHADGEGKADCVHARSPGSLDIFGGDSAGLVGAEPHTEDDSG